MAITAIYPTDKHYSGLLNLLDNIFQNVANNKLNILEIGVSFGGSLMWLLDYFQFSEIVGMDVVIPEFIEAHPRLHLVKADQNDDVYPLPFDEFDIIIDDGCHYPKETRHAFDVLWPKIVPGGVYLIEDFYVGYGEFWDAPECTGIQNVVTDIMLQKVELGIGPFCIYHKEPQCSLAWFTKRKTANAAIEPLRKRINELEKKIQELQKANEKPT